MSGPPGLRPVSAGRTIGVRSGRGLTAHARDHAAALLELARGARAREPPEALRALTRVARRAPDARSGLVAEHEIELEEAEGRSERARQRRARNLEVVAQV